MTIIEKNIRVNKNIKEIFEILYENNTDIFNDHITLIEWKKDDWYVKDKLLQRKEELYFHVPSMPNEVVSYLIENDKYIRLQLKNKIIIDTDKCKKIKTKFKILNVSPLLKTIINDLKIIKIKNKIEINQITENTSDLKIITQIIINLPKTKIINDFIYDFTEKITNSTITILS